MRTVRVLVACSLGLLTLAGAHTVGASTTPGPGASQDLDAFMATLVALFGVVFYSASMRRHEFGVRLAIGARPSAVVGAVIRESAVITLVGVAIGLMLALPVAHLVRSEIYVDTPLYDPVVSAVIVVVLTIVSLAASLLPAIRAARIDPIAALRAE